MRDLRITREVTIRHRIMPSGAIYQCYRLYEPAFRDEPSLTLLRAYRWDWDDGWVIIHDWVITER
jgi:hypothetical protein